MTWHPRTTPSRSRRAATTASPHPPRRRPRRRRRWVRAAGPPRSATTASARPSASPCSPPSSPAAARMPPRSSATRARPPATTPAATATTNPNQNSSPDRRAGQRLRARLGRRRRRGLAERRQHRRDHPAGLGAGSGVVFDKSGHILTNNHVVGDATGNGAITVTLSDGRTYGATIVGTDPSTDLAVIKLTNGPERPDADHPRRLRGPQGRRPGHGGRQPARPLGHRHDGHHLGPRPPGQHRHVERVPPRSAAVVRRRGRDERHPDVGRDQPGQLRRRARQRQGRAHRHQQLDRLARAEPGGSQSGNIGIGFAIPVKEAKSIADQLIKSGKAEHSYLGVSTRDTVVSDGAAKRAGAQVVSVSTSTPAANAGVKNGDVIIAVDGQRIDSATALVAQIREMTAGDKATLTVIRGGARQDVSVTLAVKPSATTRPLTSHRARTGSPHAGRDPGEASLRSYAVGLAPAPPPRSRWPGGRRPAAYASPAGPRLGRPRRPRTLAR